MISLLAPIDPFRGPVDNVLPASKFINAAPMENQVYGETQQFVKICETM